MRVSELKDLEGFCRNECSQIPCHMFINPITHRNRQSRYLGKGRQFTKGANICGGHCSDIKHIITFICLFGSVYHDRSGYIYIYIYIYYTKIDRHT